MSIVLWVQLCELILAQLSFDAQPVPCHYDFASLPMERRICKELALVIGLSRQQVLDISNEAFCMIWMEDWLGMILLHTDITTR